MAGDPVEALGRLLLKVILPDGNALEYSRRVRPIDVAAEIGPRLAKATLAAEVDGQTGGRQTPSSRRRGKSPRLITAKDPQALDLLPPFVRHVMARAVMRLFDGRAVGLRPDGGERLLLRFRDGARRCRRRTSRRSRPRWPGSSRKTSRSSGSRWTAARRIEFCRDLGQALKVEHLEDGLADRGDRLVLPPGRVRRPLPRAARAQRGGDRGVQTALGGRGLLEGRRLAAAVAAALRHRLVQQAGPGRPSASRSKRPSAATTACWASNSNCSLIDPVVGSGLVLWLPKGAVVRHELENFLYGELIRRGYQPVNTPVIGNVAPVRDFRPLSRITRTASSRRSRWPTDERYSAAADELPAPHQDLPDRSRGAIANCRCGWPSSARSIASSSRAS